MKDIENLKDIKLMVNQFYRLVRKDKTLGPIFTEKIGENWDHHLGIMYRFWNTVLFGDYTYNGNPFSKHVSLPIHEEHFDQWLTLFNNNLDNLFIGSKTEEARHRAQQMADMFQAKLKAMRKGGMRNII